MRNFAKSLEIKFIIYYNIGVPNGKNEFFSESDIQKRKMK